MTLDRLPPHSLESEQGVLGCCLISPSESLDQCVEKLKAGPLEFYDIRHQSLYETLTGMWERREAVDLITVQQRLKTNGTLDGIGGLAYLSTLCDSVVSTANLPRYLEILIEMSVLRGLLKACTNVIGRVHEHQGQVAELVDEVERELLAVGDKLSNGGSDLTQKDHVRAAIDSIQRAFDGSITGLRTGFDRFDNLTGGLQPADMIVIGARPSCGKTSYAFQCVETIASAGIPVGMFSLEMTAMALNKRAIGTIARVNVQQRGHWNEDQLRRMTAAGARLAKLPIHIDDRSGLTIPEIKAKARRWKKKHNIGLLVIDYLTLIQPRQSKADNRQTAVAEISNAVKGLAKELKIPVIVLCQLNRELEKGGDRKPRLSDLRESGQIEQDADVIAFLYRNDSEQDPGESAVKINLVVAKQRNGALDEIPMHFHREITLFEELSRMETQ